jgi:hypothetical protein
MFKGNEKDCICEKPKGKHRKNCDAFRLSEFLKQGASIFAKDFTKTIKKLAEH